MFQVTINKAELWGNYKDGFDNNQNYQIAKFDTDQDLEETQLSPKSIIKIAREYFAGYSFPLNENSNNFIGKRSKALTVEWESDYVESEAEGISTVVYAVFYRGQYIGEILIKEIPDENGCTSKCGVGCMYKG